MRRLVLVSLTLLALTAPAAAARPNGSRPAASTGLATLAPVSPQDTAACAGPPTAAGLAQLPGPPLRFGIAPLAQAGQVGPTAPALPDDAGKSLAALQKLRGGRPLVLRLTRLFWADGESGIARYLALAHTYTAAGFLVELQLRYRPAPGHQGDIAGWVAWVREVVDRFGSDPGVVGLQVTNEVNFNTSPDSSDGAYAGARDALIQGVIGAKAEANMRGDTQLRIGFNWFYRTDPADDASFWDYLASHGGSAFVAAVDWVGLDVYPGTFFPPSEPAGGYADAIVNALSVLRQCYMPVAGLGSAVAIYVEENGYPTGPGRSEQAQLQAMQEMIAAVNAYRGTFHVSDYRWFDLRDADSSSSNFQQQFGLLHSDYTEKPAFAQYQQLIASLSGTSGTGPQSGAGPPPKRGRRRARRGRPRVHVVVHDHHRHRAGGCVVPPVRLTLTGPDAPLVRRLVLSVDRRRVRVSYGPARSIRIGPGLSTGRHRVALYVNAGARGSRTLLFFLAACRVAAR